VKGRLRRSDKAASQRWQKWQQGRYAAVTTVKKRE